MAEGDIEHIVVPEHPVFGKKGKLGGQVYWREGTDVEGQEWREAVMLVTERSAVSPGGVAMICRAGRVEFYRLAAAGHLTLFMFHVRKRLLPLSLLKGFAWLEGPECYAPLSELVALDKILLDRPDLQKIALGDGSAKAIQQRFEKGGWTWG